MSNGSQFSPLSRSIYFNQLSIGLPQNIKGSISFFSLIQEKQYELKMKKKQWIDTIYEEDGKCIETM